MNLKNSGYDYSKKAKQVDDKLEYFSAIKSDILKNKAKLVGLDQTIQTLNLELRKYGKIKKT